MWWLRAAVRHPWADLAVAAVLLAVTLVTTAAGPGATWGRPGVTAVLTAAVACGSLALRQRWPFPVLAGGVGGAPGHPLQFLRRVSGAALAGAAYHGDITPVYIRHPQDRRTLGC